MTVLLVSIDGVAPRYVTPERMPNLTGLARSGAACYTGQTVTPPVTRPAHASMLTGHEPTIHGILDNNLDSVSNRQLAGGVRTVFAHARSCGLTTMAATNWRALDTLFEPDALTHRIFLDGGYDPEEDAIVVEQATTCLKTAKPDVAFVYLAGPDLAGHEDGWGSDTYLASLVAADELLSPLVSILGPTDSILVTTDHGGRDHSHADGDDPAVSTIFVAARSPRLAPGSFWPQAHILDVAATVADLAGLADGPVGATPGHDLAASLIGTEEPVVDHLLDLVARSATVTYGENVTMADHALQAAALADQVEGPVDDDLVIAALLHDVGHLLGSAGSYGDPDHARVAAGWLGPWLPSTVTRPIGLHVDAKRFLVATDPAYAEELSEASKATLDQQGGPFDPAGCERFRFDTQADRAVALRRFDDAGKVAGIEIPPVEHYRPRLARVLAEPPPDPAQARSTCQCVNCRDPHSGQGLLEADDLVGWEHLFSGIGADGRRHVVVTRGGERHICLQPFEPGRAAMLGRERWSSDHDLTKRQRRPDEIDTIANDVAVSGVALVTGLPTVEGTVLELAGSLGFVRETNYGRMFDVRTEPEPENLAYSPVGLPLHTDNPYRRPTPTVQILHCLRPATSGGATRLTDGVAVAERLAHCDPSAFTVLTTTEVEFRFRSDDVDLRTRRPVVEVDLEGGVRSVAVNNRSMVGPVSTELADALQVFTRLLDEAAIELTLEAGQAIVFDNTRVLHARAGFDPSSGRHLQGCYIDLDALTSTALRSG